ncbi:hypothetical protein BDR05DRAFT_965905 [Suillus weaverae]|nr:hypothetical protein BDR05DRAFT_965905 [Suillus weaverae]
MPLPHQCRVIPITCRVKPHPARQHFNCHTLPRHCRPLPHAASTPTLRVSTSTFQSIMVVDFLTVRAVRSCSSFAAG